MVEEYAKDVIMKERKRWLLFGIPWTFTKYTLTPKRIILNEGLLRSTENEILLYRIIDMELSKTLFQKIFKLGTVTVKSKDASHPILEIKNIKNVEKFFEVVDSCEGKVELVGEDIRLNLKSKLAQYFSIAKIFSDGEIPELEVVAYNQEDISKLIAYMIDR